MAIATKPAASTAAAAPPNVSTLLMSKEKLSGVETAVLRPWPYVSTSLAIVMLDLQAATHQAVWFRTHGDDGEHHRQLVYRLTPDVYAWILWKCQRADQQWEDANSGEGGGSTLDARTRENMVALATRLPVLAEVAVAYAVAPTRWTTKPPELPRPPCPLAHLDYLDQFEVAMAAPSGYLARIEKKYRVRAEVEVDADNESVKAEVAEE